MREFWICPSILSADFARLGEEVAAVIAAGADRVHVDVMDNHYVPNLTFGPVVCSALKNYGITAPLDVHLMVEPVDDLIVQFAKAGADTIVFHPEASKHVDRSLQLIKSLGCKAGLALNPATSLSVLEYSLQLCDRVLLMSVNPGFGGQQFIRYTLEKARRLKTMIKAHQYDTVIEIDGGVKPDNIAEIAQAGVNAFVAGSAIFSQPDYAAVINAMREQLAL
jgi:ribulose-phosphate 3-epimerase